MKPRMSLLRMKSVTRLETKEHDSTSITSSGDKVPLLGSDVDSPSSPRNGGEVPLRASAMSRSASVTNIMGNFRQHKPKTSTVTPRTFAFSRTGSVTALSCNDDSPSRRGSSGSRTSRDKMRAFTFSRTASVTNLSGNEDSPSSTSTSMSGGKKMPLRGAFVLSRSSSVTNLMSNFRQRKPPQAFTVSQSASVADLSSTMGWDEEDFPRRSSILSNATNGGDNMEEPSPTVVRAVHFSRKRKCREIPSRKVMTNDERHTLWYTQAELQQHNESENQDLLTSVGASMLLNVQDIDTIFYDMHYLSACMDSEETELLLCDASAIAEHAHVFQKLSSTTTCSTSSSTNANGEVKRQSTAGNILASQMSDIRQTMAKNARQVVLNGYLDDKAGKVARAYHEECRTAVLFARIIAAADAQAVKDDDDNQENTVSFATMQGDVWTSASPFTGASPHSCSNQLGLRRPKFHRSASAPALFQI